MPFMGGGGAAFNGGTVTKPLTISDAITGTLLRILGAHTDLKVDGAGDVELVGDTGVELALSGTGLGNNARIATQNDAGDSFTADTGSGINMYAAGLQLFNCNPGENLVLFGGAVAAPNAVHIDPGTFALWLDQTPGATALNIKAKDSGGTVRTASIALA